MTPVPVFHLAKTELQEGTTLIEASAGTGKTWTIAALYLRLVLGHGGPGIGHSRPLLPGEILVMTFTIAATRELSEDLAKIAHELVADVTPVADVALEFKDEKGNSATLLDKPCENAAILKVGAEKYGIPDTYLDRMRAGKMLYEGKSYETCWVLGPDGTVYIVDSAGDMSGIPVDAFERPTGS